MIASEVDMGGREGYGVENSNDPNTPHNHHSPMSNQNHSPNSHSHPLDTEDSRKRNMDEIMGDVADIVDEMTGHGQGQESDAYSSMLAGRLNDTIINDRMNDSDYPIPNSMSEGDYAVRIPSVLQGDVQMDNYSSYNNSNNNSSSSSSSSSNNCSVGYHEYSHDHTDLIRTECEADTNSNTNTDNNNNNDNSNSSAQIPFAPFQSSTFTHSPSTSSSSSSSSTLPSYAHSPSSFSSSFSSSSSAFSSSSSFPSSSTSSSSSKTKRGKETATSREGRQDKEGKDGKEGNEGKDGKEGKEGRKEGRKTNRVHTYDQIRQALLKYRELYGHIVVPYKFRVPTGTAYWSEDLGDIWLGKVVRNIRCGHCYSKKREDMLGMGFVYTVQPKGDYGKVKAALLAYKEKNGNMDVKYTFKIPSGDTAWPEETWDMKLGKAVRNIRCGHNYKDRQQELIKLGFNFKIGDGTLDTPLVDRSLAATVDRSDRSPASSVDRSLAAPSIESATV